MDKKRIVEFFDSLAPNWDQRLIVNEEVINVILNNAGIRANADVLDVACGTGVLIPFYLDRDVRSVTAIDISPQMSQIAAGKFAGENRVRIICGDVMEYQPSGLYDCVVVYNALPHFEDDRQLIGKLVSMLKKGGRLTIAHGMSRDKINQHHGNVNEMVKKPLESAEQLCEIMKDFLPVKAVISNSEMYLVCGQKA